VVTVYLEPSGRQSNASHFAATWMPFAMWRPLDAR
jgi:hypothetical protein